MHAGNEESIQQSKFTVTLMGWDLNIHIYKKISFHKESTSASAKCTACQLQQMGRMDGHYNTATRSGLTFQRKARLASGLCTIWVKGGKTVVE